RGARYGQGARAGRSFRGRHTCQHPGNRVGGSRLHIRWRSYALGAGGEPESGPCKTITAAGTPLSLDSIREHLTTRSIRRHFVVHGEVDSTHRAATVLAGNGAPPGTDVIADTQTHGRWR